MTTLEDASVNTVRVIAQGTLRGYVAKNGARVWRGIPYATPPHGALRWRPPQPPAAWHGELAALRDGSPSVQGLNLAAPFVDDDGDGLIGSEDCLYLNVFAPSPSPSAASESLPVMYWIHGGGNVGGHNAAATYDGSVLAQRHRVVVVTVNYRLGALGWFLHPAMIEVGASPDDRSGNWGTLDLIRGLEWVRDNIAAFGGDPGNVTIFGESAGGVNVYSLLVSPRAGGLFHRAIVQSGGLLTDSLASACNYSDDTVRGSLNSGREVVNKLLIRDGRAPDRAAAKALQDTLSHAEIAALLRQQTPRQLMEIMNPGRLRLYDAPRVLRDGAILPSEPWLETLAGGRFHKVPLITGTNRDEQRLYQMADPLWRSILKEHPGDYVRYARYTSLAWKQRAVDDVASALAQAGHHEVYTYRFDWDEQGVIGDLDMSVALGAGHSVELSFVFGGAAGLLAPLGDVDPKARLALSSSMQSYWAEFAHGGAPGRGRDGSELAWDAWNDAEDAEAAPKCLLLDTAADGGVRMSTERVTSESLKRAVLSERGFERPQLHAQLYRALFRGSAFRADEYQSVGGKLESDT
jgi:para-nitrobenzyl esterase